MTDQDEAVAVAGDIKFDKVETAEEGGRQSIQKQAPENALQILKDFNLMEYLKSSAQFYKENPVKLKKEVRRAYHWTPELWTRVSGTWGGSGAGSERVG